MRNVLFGGRGNQGINFVFDGDSRATGLLITRTTTDGLLNEYNNAALWCNIATRQFLYPPRNVNISVAGRTMAEWAAQPSRLSAQYQRSKNPNILVLGGMGINDIFTMEDTAANVEGYYTTYVQNAVSFGYAVVLGTVCTRRDMDVNFPARYSELLALNDWLRAEYVNIGAVALADLAGDSQLAAMPTSVTTDPTHWNMAGNRVVSELFIKALSTVLA